MIMLGSTTRRFTKRFQSVDVVTLSALRDHMESISTHDCRFRVEKATHDRVTIRCESAPHKPCFVVLPAYPTGHSDDSPTNPNVVLDPLEFLNADTHEERERFLPLLNHDVLAHYEKMHPHKGLAMTRCC